MSQIGEPLKDKAITESVQEQDQDLQVTILQEDLIDIGQNQDHQCDIQPEQVEEGLGHDLLVTAHQGLPDIGQSQGLLIYGQEFHLNT